MTLTRILVAPKEEFAVLPIPLPHLKHVTAGYKRIAQALPRKESL